MRRDIVWMASLIGITWSAIAAAQNGSAPAIPNERRAQIGLVIEATGESEGMDKLVDQVIAQFRKLCPDVDDAAWASYKEQLRADVAKAEEAFYDRHYSAEDLTALVTIVRSPVWQKVRSIRPERAQESRRLGQELAKTLWNQLRAKGCQTRLPPPTPTP